MSVYVAIKFEETQMLLWERNLGMNFVLLSERKQNIGVRVVFFVCYFRVWGRISSGMWAFLRRALHICHLCGISSTSESVNQSELIFFVLVISTAQFILSEISLREIRGIFSIELRKFKLGKCPYYSTSGLQRGDVFKLWQYWTKKILKNYFFCFRTASLGGSGLLIDFVWAKACAPI